MIFYHKKVGDNCGKDLDLFFVIISERVYQSQAIEIMKVKEILLNAYFKFRDNYRPIYRAKYNIEMPLIDEYIDTEFSKINAITLSTVVTLY
jgi:hypothetical protein